MIGRIWHGWTKPENADKYENLLKSETLPGIAAKGIAGYKKIEVFRRQLEKETEFITIMWFDSIESIKDFVGDDYEVAHVLLEMHHAKAGTQLQVRLPDDPF